MPTLLDAKKELLGEILDSITEDFGKDVFVKLKAVDTNEKSVISTNNSLINGALGGGFEPGKIVELYGREGVGKTTFALELAANAQKRNGFAAFVDVEHTFDRTYATSLGIDEERLWVASSYTAEEALSICEKLIRSKLFSVVILDSVAALSPKAEVEGAADSVDEWLQAQILEQALRRISKLLRDSDTLVVFINQVRDRPATCHFEGETTPGGAALKFTADYRLKLCGQMNDFVLAKGQKL